MGKLNDLYPPLETRELGTLSHLLSRAAWNFQELAVLRESELGSRALDALKSLVMHEAEGSAPNLERALRVLEREKTKAQDEYAARSLRRHRGEPEPKEKKKRRPKLTVVGE